MRLFKECMLLQLFDGSEEIADALYGQLNDETHIQRILNEGAARGLTKLFASVMTALNLPEGDREWLHANLSTEDDKILLPTEIQMVVGMLKWLHSDDRRSYATRSALVAQVTLCLKRVGYTIGKIQVWDGLGNYPQT